MQSLISIQHDLLCLLSLRFHSSPASPPSRAAARWTRDSPPHPTARCRTSPVRLHSHHIDVRPSHSGRLIAHAAGNSAAAILSVQMDDQAASASLSPRPCTIRCLINATGYVVRHAERNEERPWRMDHHEQTQSPIARALCRPAWPTPERNALICRKWHCQLKESRRS